LYKCIYLVHTSDKSRKLKSCNAQDDIPTKSEIEQYLGILLAQVLCEYSHGEDVNLVKSTPCTRSLQPQCTTQDCQPETDKWSQEKKVLKSRMYQGYYSRFIIVCILLFASKKVTKNSLV